MDFVFKSQVDVIDNHIAIRDISYLSETIAFAAYLKQILLI